MVAIGKKLSFNLPDLCKRLILIKIIDKIDKGCYQASFSVLTN